MHDILKLCQRCHADLQRELKASQRDNVSGRAHALHSGSGLSSLASSMSQKVRPLVEKGPPPGGHKGQLAKRGSAQSSGGLLNAQVLPRQQRSSAESQYVEDEEEGLQPRSMRPPAPQPIIPAQLPVPFSQDGMHHSTPYDAELCLDEHLAHYSMPHRMTIPAGQANPTNLSAGKLARMDWSDSQQAGVYFLVCQGSGGVSAWPMLCSTVAM